MKPENSGGGRSAPALAESAWYDDVRVLDNEWIEIGVTTPSGEKVYYRIPRRTLFASIDMSTP